MVTDIAVYLSEFAVPPRHRIAVACVGHRRAGEQNEGGKRHKADPAHGVSSQVGVDAGRSRQWLGAVQAAGVGTACHRLPQLAHNDRPAVENQRFSIICNVATRPATWVGPTPRTIPAMRFGAAYWIQRTDWPSLRDACLAAEAAGFDSVWLDDHLLSDEGDWHAPKLEGWTALAALATITVTGETLGHLVAANTFRNPGLIAKQAVTMDHLSGGCFRAGMAGAGSNASTKPSASTSGPGSASALDRLDEAVGLIRRLLDGENVTHEGRFYTFRDALCVPRPIQPRLPILVGGSGRARPSRPRPGTRTCGMAMATRTASPRSRAGFASAARRPAGRSRPSAGRSCSTS